MPAQNPYHPFPHFVLRTPLFPVGFFEKLTSGEHISDGAFQKLFADPVVKEAVFLASPPLHGELERWVAGELTDAKKTEKLRYSFLKYLARMASRCTPFGLFAGCSVGELGSRTELQLRSPEKNDRHTRLDMNYLVALSQELAKREDVKKQLLFFPNTSLYRAGDQLRYVEYQYVNARRRHHIVAVDATKYLEKVLSAASEGAGLSDLAKRLVSDEVTKAEAMAFIDELVDSQLLVSELEPSVSGPEFLEQIRAVLSRLKGTEKELEILDKADALLKELDSALGNPPAAYTSLAKTLKPLGTKYELKYLFQTDMVLSPRRAVLDTAVVRSVQRGLALLNRLTLPPGETFMEQFAKAYYERYEEGEAPLPEALDVEMGVGYRQDRGSGDVNPLVDDLALPPRPGGNSYREVRWSGVQDFFQKKLIQAFSDGAYSITLTDKDLKGFEAGWDDLPGTLSTMVELVRIDREQKIKFSSAGGSGAANLLARFCHGDEVLQKHTRRIIEKETEQHKDKLLAEIVHLPESRVGNILMRPALRQYEIPYLARSLTEKENQLPLDDLQVSVKYGRRVTLRSKKYGKEIIPRLTNAHNYTSNSLPIYHFLCDLQTQGLRAGISLHLGPFAGEYPFIPRIEYEDLILHEATWNLKKRDIKPLQKAVGNDKKLTTAVKALRKERKIPRLVMLTDGDNELLVNLENLSSVRMLLSTVKNRSGFKLTEFLFAGDGVVKGDKKGAHYTNQIVLSFYREQGDGGKATGNPPTDGQQATGNMT